MCIWNTQTKIITLYATRDNFLQWTEMYVCQKVYVRRTKTHIWWGVWAILNDWWLLVYVLACGWYVWNMTKEIWAIHPTGYLLLDMHFLSLSRILTYCTVLSNALITLPMNISVCVHWMHVYVDGTIVSLSQSQMLLTVYDLFLRTALGRYSMAPFA